MLTLRIDGCFIVVPEAHLHHAAPPVTRRKDWMTPMMKKLMSFAIAATVVAGAVATTANDAEARRGRGFGLGVAAGVIGLGILGAAAAANAGPRYYGYGGGGCYRGARQCGWTGRSCYTNRYGEYVCGGGQMVCQRPLICP